MPKSTFPTEDEVDMLKAHLRALGFVDGRVLAKHGILKTPGLISGYQIGMTEYASLQTLLDNIWTHRKDAEAHPEDYQIQEMGQFLLKGGNLDHINAQMKFLGERGFQIEGFRTGLNSLNPGLSGRDDYEKAVQEIFLAEIPGWWSYRPEDFGVLGFLDTMAKKYPKDKDKEGSWKRDKYEAIKV